MNRVPKFGLKRRLRKLLGASAPTPVAAVPLQPATAAPPIDWEVRLQREAGAWAAARRAAQSGPLVLIATSTGGHAAMTAMESVLGVALTLRGANVHFLLCDSFLPACMQAIYSEFPDPAEFAAQGPQQRLCAACDAAGQAAYGPLGLPIHRYSDYVTVEERQRAKQLAQDTPGGEIASYQMDGRAVGEHAMAGALRFFAKGSLEDEPQGLAILRRYFEASLLTAFAIQRLLSQQAFTAVCFHHGIYVPQGLIGEVARHQGVRVVNWTIAYRKKCFIFSHGDTYHHTLMNEPVASWENLPWTPAMETELMDYLVSRWQGSRDWISFHENPQKDLAAITAELQLDLSKPTIGLLTNVIWDAQLHYPANAFPDMRTWLLQTIEYFARRPELQLVIRVHPAEIRGTIPSRQPVVEEIRRTFPSLPPNIYLIGPENPISTYAIMLASDSVIIYGTKTGVELTSFGVPTIVAGEAWIRNKGLTFDASSAAGYFQILDQLPVGQRLDPATTRRARQYAYHFFFRRMTPVAVIEQSSGWPPYRLTATGLADLQPGRDLGLDVICQGILEGTPFIYPAETLVAAVAA